MIKECCVVVESGTPYLGVIDGILENPDGVRLTMYSLVEGHEVGSRSVSLGGIDCSNQLILQHLAKRFNIDTGLRFTAVDKSGEIIGFSGDVVPWRVGCEWVNGDSENEMSIGLSTEKTDWGASLNVLITNQEGEQLHDRFDAEVAAHEAWAERCNEYTLSGSDDRPSMPSFPQLPIQELMASVRKANEYVPDRIVSNEQVPF